MSTQATHKYNNVAVLLHWLVAMLIIGLLIVGWLMTDLEKGTALRKQVYNWHKSFGLIVLILVLARIYWRLRSRIPEPLEKNPYLVWLAHIAHLLIYLLIAFVPLIALAAGSFNRGFDFFVWHWEPLFAIDTERAHTLMYWHGLAAYVLAGFVGFHVLAALWHQFIRRDHIFKRIWFG
jgi:cytochrome b561